MKAPDKIFLHKIIELNDPGYYDPFENSIYMYDGDKILMAYCLQQFAVGVEYTKVTKVTKQQLLKYLNNIESYIGGDFEDHHRASDMLLLLYIDDTEIKDAFNGVGKWYA